MIYAEKVENGAIRLLLRTEPAQSEHVTHTIGRRIRADCRRDTHDLVVIRFDIPISRGCEHDVANLKGVAQGAR